MTNKEPIKYFSMFSGIGGFEYGLQQSHYKFENVGFSEIDKYARSIYEKHYPNHTGYGDATKIRTEELPDFDFLVGGFPCQAFSIAGKRQGFNDTRGTLFFEIARILQDKKPGYFLLENVKGLLSHDKGKTFQTILKILSELGYNVRWQIHNSKDYGVPQNRERIFIEGYLGGECGGEVLYFRGNDKTPDVPVSNTYWGARTGLIHCPDEHMNTLTATGQNSGSRQLIKYKVDECIGSTQKHATHTDGSYAPTLTSAMGEGGGHVPMMKIKKVGNISPGNHYDGTVYSDDGLSPTLRARDYKSPVKICKPVLTPDRENKRQNGRRIKEDGEPMFTLTAQDGHGVTDNYRIRKLTPKECEKLQGFPANWTKYGKDGELISDTQRYKCCGNAVTTNVITSIVNKMFKK